jgi:hypothetical protein
MMLRPPGACARRAALLKSLVSSSLRRVKMQHLEGALDPSWVELESSASRAALQLSARQIAFSNEQPPPELFDHLVTWASC